MELLRGLKPKCGDSLSAVLGKLTKACFRGIMSFMCPALTPTGGSGSAAGSTSSRPLTAQILFHDKSCCSVWDYCRCCPDRRELFYTHILQTSAELLRSRGEGCRSISSVGCCEPPNPAWISACYYTCKQ